MCVCVAQSMLDSTAAKLDNVQQLIDQIESAKLNVQIFESLKQGMMEREPFFFCIDPFLRNCCPQGAEFSCVCGGCGGVAG